MYIGALSDFFYKPKDFLINLPKFKQRQEFSYLNINNRIFRINNITGSITLLNNPKYGHLTKNDKSYKNKAEYKSRNSGMNFTMSNTSKTKETKITDYSNRTMDNTTIKNNELKKIINNHRTKIKKIPILDLINTTKIKSIKYVERAFKNQIFPYYNKTPKKLKKPEIIFGHKINNETIPNKKRINHLITNDKNDKNEKNSFLTIYRQHYNNINNEGNNNKIYFEEKNDNLMMKAFKNQILKERVVKDLKKKYQFYDNKKSVAIQIPNLSPKNFEFYNGYTISGIKKGSNNYHKLFFRYLNKHKHEESNENQKKLLTDLE